MKATGQYHGMELLSSVVEMKMRMQLLGSSTLSTGSKERSPHRESVSEYLLCFRVA